MRNQENQSIEHRPGLVIASAFGVSGIFAQHRTPSGKCGAGASPAGFAPDAALSVTASTNSRTV